MKISSELTALFLELEKDDENEFKVYKNYSGRGMYGRKCFGVVVRDGYSWIGKIINYITDTDENYLLDELAELLENASTDNMAYDTIIYFPRWELDESISVEDLNDDDDD